MKTNQLMTTFIHGGAIQTYHKTGEFVLSDVFRVGNKFRVLEGKSIASQPNFLASGATQEFIAVCERRNGGRPVLRVEGRGRSAKTWVSVHLAIYAAEYLSTEFHWEVIDTFVNSKLLEWRDASGDNFKALNVALDTLLVDRKGKNNRSVFIQMAKMMKQAVKPDGDSWNTASADQLRMRATIEDKLAEYMDMGFVTTWPQVKEQFATLVEKYNNQLNLIEV